ncbi:hypothetical protein ACFL09_05170 [Planctomycetota bacterium]
MAKHVVTVLRFIGGRKPGVKGEYRLAGHPDWFYVGQLRCNHWAIPGVAGMGFSLKDIVNAAMNEFEFVTQRGKGTDRLAQACANEEWFDKVVIESWDSFYHKKLVEKLTCIRVKVIVVRPLGTWTWSHGFKDWCVVSLRYTVVQPV